MAATAEDLLRELMGGNQSYGRTAFTKLLPYEQFVNPELLKAIARGRIMPEENQNKRVNLDRFDDTGVGSGAYRTGRFIKNRARASDSLDRSAEERVNSFYQPMVDEMTNRYNMLYETFTKDPSSEMFKNINLLTPKYSPNSYSNPTLPEIRNPYLDNTMRSDDPNNSTTINYGAGYPRNANTLTKYY